MVAFVTPAASDVEPGRVAGKSALRVNELDLLRFIAALAVVFYHSAFRGYAAHYSPVAYPHLAPVAKYGFLGVQLFFLISGFVILMTASSGSLRRFAVSRFVRLYPAFWVCCTITFVLSALIGPPRWSVSFPQYAVNMTMLSGFVGVPSIDGVYWSLFVEMKFYALVAVVLLIRQIEKAQLFLLGWLAASAILEFLPPGLPYTLLIVDYAPYFIAGATCFLVLSRGLSPLRLGMVIASCVLAVIHAIRILPEIEAQNGTTMNRYVVAAVITACFAVIFLISLRRKRPSAHKSWLLAGALTYPLYLLHQNIAYMLLEFGYPAVNAALLLVMTITALLALSYAVHVFVEKRYSPVLKGALNRVLDSMQQRGRG